jgi:hypothetical protein
MPSLVDFSLRRPSAGSPLKSVARRRILTPARHHVDGSPTGPRRILTPLGWRRDVQIVRAARPGAVEEANVRSRRDTPHCTDPDAALSGDVDESIAAEASAHAVATDLAEAARLPHALSSESCRTWRTDSAPVPDIR